MANAMSQTKAKRKRVRDVKTRSRGTRRAVLKWSAVALSIVAVPIVLVFLINSVDQDVRSEAVAFADPPKDEISPAQNAYFALVGHTAAPTDDPHRKGMEVVALHNRLIAQAPAHAVTVADARELALGPQRVLFRGRVSDICDPTADRCLADYRERARDIEEMLRNNRILVSRYYALYRYPRYREMAQPSVHFLGSWDDSNTNALVRAAIGLQAVRGQTGAALQALQRDTRFHRLVLRDAETLVAKMIAVKRIQRNLLLLSEIIGAARLDGRNARFAKETAASFDDAELGFQRVFRGEFRFARQTLQTLDGNPVTVPPGETGFAALARPLYKRQATINLEYKKYRFLADLADLSQSELYAELSSGRVESAYDREWLGLHSIYNPLGKLFVNLTPSSLWIGYIGRAKNLEALARLVRLQLAARTRRVGDSQMPEFLARAEAPLRNPYTGESARWDVATRSLYFMCLRENTKSELLGKRIAVALSP
jgi:hypothetical protein